jgi:predicted metal-binding membrane protein
VIERVLRHERRLVLAGVVAVAGLAWFDLWRRARGMMDMAMPEMEPWSLAEFGAILAMWLVMMIAMMLPSAARSSWACATAPSVWAAAGR